MNELNFEVDVFTIDKTTDEPSVLHEQLFWSLDSIESVTGVDYEN